MSIHNENTLILAVMLAVVMSTKEIRQMSPFRNRNLVTQKQVSLYQTHHTEGNQLRGKRLMGRTYSWPNPAQPS